MYCKLHLIYFLFFLSILELHTVTAETEETEQTTVMTLAEQRRELLKLGWEVHCKFQANGFNCNQNKTSEGRFYYDVAMGSCKTFEYGGCDLSFNSFSTLFECNNVCRVPGVVGLNETLPAEVSCRLQYDFGDCNNYVPMWYFDMTERRCKGFSYSGCGGNGNRFTTSLTCFAICSGAIISSIKGLK